MSDADRISVGFVGLGIMGAAMATRLIGAGYPVSVYNRDARRATALAELGARVCGSPAELAQGCEVIAGCLLDTAAVRQVYLGDAGIVAWMPPGGILVEHGTFDPALAREVAQAAQSRGGAFLDAPVTGGPEGARAGTLTTMVGGDATALAAVEPLLRAYSARVLLVGGPGSGLILKLVNQLLVSIHLSAAAEAAALVGACGLDLDVCEEVLTSGWGASTMLARSLPLVARGSFTSTGATVGGLLEIQRLVHNLGTEVGLQLATFEAACSLFDMAESLGLGGSDPASLVQLLRAGSSANAEAGAE